MRLHCRRRFAALTGKSPLRAYLFWKPDKFVFKMLMVPEFNSVVNEITLQEEVCSLNRQIPLQGIPVMEA